MYIYSVLTFSFLYLYFGRLHDVVRGKAKLSSPPKKPIESAVDGTPVSVSSAVSSPLSSSPLKREQESLLSVIILSVLKLWKHIDITTDLWWMKCKLGLYIWWIALEMNIIFNCNNHHRHQKRFFGGCNFSGCHCFASCLFFKLPYRHHHHHHYWLVVLPSAVAASKSKTKRAKQVSSVEPLQDGEEVTDTTGKKWKLVKILSQTVTELIYEGETSAWYCCKYWKIKICSLQQEVTY